MQTPRPPQQLDIFADSFDVMLRNDVVAALERPDAPAAAAATQRLAAEYPKDADLVCLQLLVQTLSGQALPAHTVALADHAALAAARRHIEIHVAPAAHQTMGHAAARAWLRPLWCRLAARAGGLAFSSEHSDDHAAALWLRGEDWAAAVTAVQGIESWRRIPAPLAWMLQARFQLDGLDACWALLAELAWLAPARLAAMVQAELRDPLLTRLLKNFHANFENDADENAAQASSHDLAWFPAWVLTQTPALASLLGAAQPGQHSRPERGLRAVLALLLLERQGAQAEQAARRRALRELHPGLYAAFMSSR
jgi:hypothetical protein